MIDGGISKYGIPIIAVLQDIASFPPFLLKFLIINVFPYFGLLGFDRYRRQHWS